MGPDGPAQIFLAQTSSDRVVSNDLLAILPTSKLTLATAFFSVSAQACCPLFTVLISSYFDIVTKWLHFAEFPE